MKKQPNGFTLLEMLVAISIITVIVVIGLPFYRNLMQNLNLSSATRTMASDLRYAQQLSVTSQVNHQVIFDLISESYQIKNSQTQTIIKIAPLPDDISLDSVNDLPDNTITFNATGAATSTGTIILSNLNYKTSTIEIKPSGYVKIR